MFTYLYLIICRRFKFFLFHTKRLSLNGKVTTNCWDQAIIDATLKDESDDITLIFSFSHKGRLLPGQGLPVQ